MPGRSRSPRLRGGDTFVFFGYTHCADVCPATIGRVGEALAALGSGERAVFVTVDPERDTTAWLNEFVRYMPKGFSAVTGTDSEIAATAADWGVRYAREETGVDGAYTMSHTADVYLVDAAGMLRARFPFGTEADVMTAVAREVASTAAAAATLGARSSERDPRPPRRGARPPLRQAQRPRPEPRARRRRPPGRRRPSASR